jgi:hypothetical protein
VTVWADVPEERREWDGEAGWWGSLLEGKPPVPSSRVPTEVEVELAELEDIKDRVDAEPMGDVGAARSSRGSFEGWATLGPQSNGSSGQ